MIANPSPQILAHSFPPLPELPQVLFWHLILPSHHLLALADHTASLDFLTAPLCKHYQKKFLRQQSGYE
jgi:hypothetical protein